MTTYFSDREGKTPPQQTDRVSDAIWAGVRAVVAAYVDRNYFARSYPETCPDSSSMTSGTNETDMRDAMCAEISGLPTWPWRDFQTTPASTPPTPAILDMIEFCSSKIAAPKVLEHHRYYRHDHLRFDPHKGQAEFREDINRILRRNGVVYRLTDNHQVQRSGEPVFRKPVAAASFDTGDTELDRMLQKAQTKFLDRDFPVRREALEALWDAWERLKTLPGPNKKAHAAALLREVAGPSSPQFLQVIEEEAKQLTRIGNTMQIRHSETDQERLDPSEHVDYVFYRMWAFLSMILRLTGRLALPQPTRAPEEPTPAANLPGHGDPFSEDENIPF